MTDERIASTDSVSPPTGGSPHQAERTDSSTTDPQRRRRLRRPRPSRGGGASGTSPQTSATRHVALAPEQPTLDDQRENDRGLRGLVGAGASQLTVSAAMRARDAARPTEADLAAAEEQVVIVHRNWIPPEHR